MYLITGATGNVGSHVVDRLLASGRNVRVFTRDAGKVARWGDRVDVAIGDFGQPDTFARAMAGVDGVFLMNGGADGEPFRQLLAGAKAQAEADGRTEANGQTERGSGSRRPRMVFLSTLFATHADQPIGKLHLDKEDAIRAAGFDAAFIRPGGFMTNAYQWIATIKSEGTVYNAMGEGRSAPIAPEDIAAVVFTALTEPALAQDVFELTGGELLTVPEQVAILSEAVGKEIRCVDVPSESIVPFFIRAGAPPHVAAGVAQSFQAIREGRGAIVNDTVSRVTGRPPKTFKVWAAEHASRFA